jgi:hypothetical protein
MTLVWNNPSVTLEAHEHFQKGSFRNRCRIAGPNGLQRLSIPLVQGKNQQTPIRDVRIAYAEPWQRNHWRSMVTAYGSAPFFEHYRDKMATFYNSRPVFLFDFNLALFEWIATSIGMNPAWTLSSGYENEVSDDFRGVILPKQRSNPSWFQPMAYSQVFADRFGFVADLSVIDLLFCYGKQSGQVLHQSYCG